MMSSTMPPLPSRPFSKPRRIEQRHRHERAKDAAHRNASEQRLARVKPGAWATASELAARRSLAAHPAFDTFAPDLSNYRCGGCRLHPMDRCGVAASSCYSSTYAPDDDD